MTSAFNNGSENHMILAEESVVFFSLNKKEAKIDYSIFIHLVCLLIEKIKVHIIYYNKYKVII